MPGGGELQRSADLIEQLLADPELRRRFRTDPAMVLQEHELPGLASGLGHGERALMTLELRESRSSLAGVMVAAAAEGVDFTHVAEHAAPGLERDASRALDKLINSHGHHAARPAAQHPAVTPPAKPSLGPHASIPPLAAAQPAPTAAPAAPAQPGVVPASAHVAPAGQPRPGRAAPDDGGGPVAPRRPAHAPSAAQSPGPSGSFKPHTPVARDQPAAHPSTHDLSSSHGAPMPDPAPSAGTLEYPGDQATPQQLAGWLGVNAQQAGLPPELPVMAALTESGLHNLNYGDRDSVGFFQMRLGIWNQGAYAGYPNNPQLQVKWFIDHALQARQQNPALAQSPSTWGEWIANVEQPAAEYRYRYQLQLGTAQDLLRGTDPTSGGQPASAAPAPPVHPAPPPAPGPTAVQTAMRHLGSPSKLAGSSPGSGFDGPGLVQYAYAQEGIQLPHVAAEQFDVGIPVTKTNLRPGDAVFFAAPNGYVHDVGLYIGNGRFVHAAEPGAPTRISALSDPPFAGQYAGARRYTAAALGDPSKFARQMPAIEGK